MEKKSFIYVLIIMCALLLVVDAVQIKHVADLKENSDLLAKELIQERMKSKILDEELNRIKVVPAVIKEFSPPAPTAIATPIATAIVMNEPVKITVVGYFNTNSTEVNKEFETELQSAVDKAKASGKVSVIVKGFADKTGSYDYNVRLSKARADGVLSKVTSLLGDDTVSGKASVGMGPSPDNKRKVVVVITTDSIT
jgi:outer membrane protein OmpA-like peptidoglycan-associated protein